MRVSVSSLVKVTWARRRREIGLKLTRTTLRLVMAEGGGVAVAEECPSAVMVPEKEGMLGAPIELDGGVSPQNGVLFGGGRDQNQASQLSKSTASFHQSASFHQARLQMFDSDQPRSLACLDGREHAIEGSC